MAIIRRKNSKSNTGTQILESRDTSKTGNEDLNQTANQLARSTPAFSTTQAGVPIASTDLQDSSLQSVMASFGNTPEVDAQQDLEGIGDQLSLPDQNVSNAPADFLSRVDSIIENTVRDREGLQEGNTALQQAIAQSIGNLGQRGAITEELQGEFGITGKSQELDEIENTIRSKNKAVRDRMQSIRNDGGLSQRQQEARAGEVQRKAVDELADLSIIQQAKQNNLSTARDIVNEKVELRFADEQTRLQGLKFFYQENKDLLDQATQEEISNNNLKQETKLAKLKTDYGNTEQQKLQLLERANANGAPLNVLKDITSSQTLGQAYEAGDTYLSSQNGFEFKKVGDNAYKFNPQTGEAERITGVNVDTSGMTLANRNNNPLNLKDFRTGEFMTFQNSDQGFMAADQDLLNKMQGATSTDLTPQSSLRDLINTWAPPADNNLNNDNYVSFVADKIGVSPDTSIGNLTGRVSDLSRAMAEFEGWQPVQLSPSAQAFIDGDLTREDLTSMSTDKRDEIITEIANAGRSIDETGQFENLKATRRATESNLEVIDSLLANEQGLELSSGTLRSSLSPESITARSLIPGVGPVIDFVRGRDNRADFVADLRYIINNLTFDKLKELKASGATFGALSDGELRAIGGAASVLGGMVNEDKDSLNASEDKVREALKELKSKWTAANDKTDSAINDTARDTQIRQFEEQRMDNIVNN